MTVVVLKRGVTRRLVCLDCLLSSMLAGVRINEYLVLGCRQQMIFFEIFVCLIRSLTDGSLGS